MTAILLALVLADGAVNASEFREYKIVEEQEGGGRAEPAPVTHEWTPRVQTWSVEKVECPAFFKGAIKGFGLFRIGARCIADHDPVAL
jgi:hypothetical protein